MKFKLLSHPDRAKILLMLEQREHCVCEITKKLNVPKSALSYHLGLLKKYGIVYTKKRSRFAFYMLSHAGKRMLGLFQK
ncbi:MAG: metalloregulator ArsR/SmtB family transcription factor [Euryarchaeota archaeon]|nr:metalloregulator ArsR/SmtB family transcription factor [Euryarchaeota archaeon]MBU4491864.1 metalloregulator ArsR/SmtB family transcription factor [Euryarchaeota archaeon]MCG2711660.1 metalloregulator ArsR/SmtB family transcription factor [Candidatus Omnitrophota bacterium]